MCDIREGGLAGALLGVLLLYDGLCLGVSSTSAPLKISSSAFLYLSPEVESVIDLLFWRFTQDLDLELYSLAKEGEEGLTHWRYLPTTVPWSGLVCCGGGTGCFITASLFLERDRNEANFLKLFLMLIMNDLLVLPLRITWGGSGSSVEKE